MPDSPAYFDLIGGSGKSKLPNGNYRAIIIDMTTVTDIKCGSFIADVFKPVYKVTSEDYKDIEVSDKEIVGHAIIKFSEAEIDLLLIALYNTEKIDLPRIKPKWKRPFSKLIKDLILIKNNIAKEKENRL